MSAVFSAVLGEYMDAESGLIYMRARYYDPVTAQFLSRDPLAASTGAPYRYAESDPLNQSDSSGLAPWDGLCIYNPFSSDNGTRKRHPIQQKIANRAGGALNFVTAGNARTVTRALGIEGNVDWCSPDVAEGTNDVVVILSGGESEGENPSEIEAEAAGSTVGDVLSQKKGSITRAPLPEGSPSWDDIRGMTMKEVEARARANEPGYKEIKKLLTDSRFNR